jgi:CDP-diacylglycerol--glycerol-3-phosphate 3-phosphatidyltransferase
MFPMLDAGGIAGHISAFFLTILLIGLDAIDGIVARRLKETSEFGGVFDIVVDRIVENCFWIYFAARGVIPVWIPFIIISRGMLTDGIRSVAFKKGMTAFGEKTLQKSLLGKALVSSRWSRGLYGFSKILAFLALIVLHGLPLPGSESIIGRGIAPAVRFSSYAIVYFTVAFCIARALPVFWDSRSFLYPRKAEKE